MKNKWRSLVLRLSDGLVGTVMDLLLFQIYLLTASVGKGHSAKGIYQAFAEAEQEFEKFNYQTIKSALKNLKRKGLIRVLKEPEITKEGRKRLKSFLPRYDEKRVWDGSLYLVTYDIAEKKKILRDKLRNFLKTLGAGKLQESVWLTVYNPQTLLTEFAKENKLGGAVIVSCIGKDGYIGQKSLSQLLNKVFNLEALNQRYEEFLREFSQKNKPQWQVAVNFYKILRDDPQLPWELLPKDWQGDKAFQLFKNKFK